MLQLSYLCQWTVIMTAHKKPAAPSKLKDKNTWLRIYFLSPAVEAAISIGLVFGSPSESGSTWFLGLSATRWLLVAGLTGIFLLFSFFTWTNRRKNSTWERIKEKVALLVDNPRLYSILIGISLIITVLSFYLILFTFIFTDQFIQARLQRMFPLFLWLFLFFLQTIIVIPQIKASAKRAPKNASFRVIGEPALLTFGSLVLVTFFVSGTRFGLQPDRVGWDNPGVPLLGTQIALAWVLGISIFGLFWLVAKRFGWKVLRIDLVVGLLLWLFAIWWWQSQPLTPTYFSPTPRAPNYEYYPYSDAATHDLGAQNLLIGNGFPDVLEKPLYSLFLAILHLLVGQDYQNIVNAQIVVLALFPVGLYLLGSKFHHRISGGLLAFAIIFREANAIALSGDIRVSHSKLLMTDLPTALAIAVFILLLMRWLQARREDSRWLIAVGGALGLLALLRSQTIIFLPALLVTAFWRGGPILTKRFRQSVILLLGFLLALFPWLFRNYLVSGQFGYSQPLQAAYLAKQYSLTPELAETSFPEGTPVSNYVSLGFSKVKQFTIRHPVEVVGFVSAHFFHNEVSSLLNLPMRFDLADKLATFYNLRPYWVGLESRLWKTCCSLDAYVTDTPYWQNWDGIFPADAWLPVLFNLSVISVGIAAAWKKTGWLILVPIGIHLFYNISTAVARVSGWRLILPVDWVWLLFYCLGIGQISLWAWEYIKMTRSEKPVGAIRQKTKPVRGWLPQRMFSLGAVILFAGFLLPLSEKLFPAYFESPTAEVAQAAWNASDLSAVTDLRIANFLSQPQARVLIGRALYPRFYPAHAGEPGEQESAFHSLPFSRITFWLVGPKGNQVALPLESAPAVFPNSADVLVIGCEDDAYFRAIAIVFADPLTPDLLTDAADPFFCAR